MATILVVDDSQTDRLRAAGLLSRAGFTVLTASDGREALERLASDPPDAIVTDLRMPRLDGMELVTEALRDFPLIPIVIMTSQGCETTAVSALHAGAANYVPKRDLAVRLAETMERVCQAAEEDRGMARLTDRLRYQQFRFELETDLDLIQVAVRCVRNKMANLSWLDGGTGLRLCLAFEEALVNAVYHGNLELQSALREEDPNVYYELAVERSVLEPYRSRTVVIDLTLAREEIKFRIADQGQGFDPSRLPDPTDPENLTRASGRGLLLIHTFMDEVRYGAGGTEITMVKRFASEEDEKEPPEVTEGAEQTAESSDIAARS